MAAGRKGCKAQQLVPSAMDDIGRWLKGYQGTDVDLRLLKDADVAARRIGALATTSASKLPFDVDPTGFAKVFSELARSRKKNA